MPTFAENLLSMSRRRAPFVNASYNVVEKKGPLPRVPQLTTGQKVGNVVKRALFGPSNVVNLVSPIGLGGATAATGLLARGGAAVRAGLRSIGIGGVNPLKNIALNTGRFASAAGLASYAATGEIPSPTTRTISGYLAAQLSLPAALIGAVTGFGKEATQYGKAKVEDFFQQGIPWVNYTPNVQIPQGPQFPQIPQGPQGGYQDIFNSLAPQVFQFETPAAPSINYTAPAVNVQGGGGLGDSLFPLLLLGLVGGGGLGYLLGRRKRKKRKYKKKRRR